MKTVFLLMAFIMLLLYAPYFFALLRGKAKSFELYISKEMTSEQNPFFNMRSTVLFMALIAVIMDVLYFLGAWYAVDIQLFRWITLAFGGLEAFHVLRTLLFLYLYLQGKINWEKLFLWPLERTVALLFYIHAVLGVLLIVWP